MAYLSKLYHMMNCYTHGHASTIHCLGAVLIIEIALRPSSNENSSSQFQLSRGLI